AVRHQVAVTEPRPEFQVERQAMAFDVGAGLYWRLEDGGLLFGFSNPDYTPDHQPILGPALDREGAPIEGVTVASPGGHGMMWGPAVAKIAADLALEGRTELTDLRDLGLDRFDSQGVSRIAPDPIALPFPTSTP